MPAVVETFEQIARHQSLAVLVDFLLTLNKTDLLPVRQHTKQLYREVYEWRDEDESQRFPSERESHLFLAGLATYSKQEGLVRTFNVPWGFELGVTKHANAGHYDLFLAVVRHSRPGWLTAWFERVARNDTSDTAPYDVIRQLAEEGLISPAPWLLAQAVAHWLQQFDHDEDRYPREYELHVLRQLHADPVLLTRDLPLLFKFDTDVDGTYLYLGDDQESVTWLTLMPQLAASGHLNRAELGTRCLLAMHRNFRRSLLTWFKDVFLALKPTADEQLAHQAELLELMAHPLAQVVNFALDQFKGLWLLPGFDVEALFPYVDNLLTRSDLKTSLKALLSGFEKLTKARPELAPMLATRYAAALAHPDAGVQERAAKSLANLLGAKQALLNATATADTVATLQELGELLSTPARTLLALWLAPVPAPSITPESYVPRVGFVPDISEATAIKPVADWHELLFLTGQALQIDQPAAAERWLDGLLRLRGQYPADYATQLRPYLLQAFPWLLKGKTEAETIEILGALDYGQHLASRTGLLRALLVSWYGGFTQLQVARVELQSVNYAYPDPLLGPARQRLLAAEARLAPGAVPLPMLSTPTHQPFWVAPTALISKLLAYEAASQTPDAADLALALGRLAWNAPTDAATARQQLANLHHSGLRELLAWLLAPSEAPLSLPPVKLSKKSQPKVASGNFDQWVSNEGLAPLTLADALPWLWAVAARTRSPHGIWTELAALADYPGLAKPWRPDWGIAMRTEVICQPYNQKQPERVEQYEELTIATVAPAAPPSPLLLYSLHAQLPQKHHNYFWLSTEDVSFLLSLLPNNPAPLQWHLLRSCFRSIPGYSEQAIILSKQLHALLTDGPAYEESTSVLLAVGLLFDKPEARALAWEVLLAAVDTGRLVPVMLGQALGRLLAGSYAPVLRLGDALPAVRGISPATDDALRQLLEALLPELPAAPLRNTAKLLAAYADFRREQPLPAVVQTRLLEWQAVNSLKKAATVLLNQ
ncbi:hypothetical protein D0N36_10175 [Hymenobacter lapidiphilus]|uniref:DUF6493 family protein n=1 Tax=Hymenobacter sp. CCM 8763 TaxID=2303334 RepID=UPI000E34B8EA|nr:DUF6493 family protein [Hymenobacter sp. CCM 8763]RFP65219.1 hypothetical protein D0N36_10175 [Hymenobacter sp. CCM 8763]